MSLEYNDYIKAHIMNVNNGLQWMIDNLPLKVLGFSDDDISGAIDRVSVHDTTKFLSDEYGPYDAYFYGGNRSNKVCTEYDHAWLRHIHRNPHHWQYWILHCDDPKEGMKILEIPGCYILEMLADWWSFSWKDDDLYKIFDWWGTHGDYILLHKRTRTRVENTLNALREKLDENDILEHGELTEEELEKRKYAFPEQRKFPMPDARHVKSAIRFFNYVDRKDEEKLAKAILERMKEYGMSFEDFTVGDENRFKKYIPNEEDHLEHFGILGQKWGIRRYQNKDGTLTELGKRRRDKELQKDIEKHNYGKDETLRKEMENSYKEKDAHHVTGNPSKKYSPQELEKHAKVLSKELEKLSKDKDADPELIELLEMELEDTYEALEELQEN